MFLDGKKGCERGKKGLYVLNQNLVIVIIILLLAGVVMYILYKFASKQLVAQP